MDYASASELDEGYEVESPDADNMILDAVVGIMDPLRGDVKDAVSTAQHAGVMVREGKKQTSNSVCTQKGSLVVHPRYDHTKPQDERCDCS